MNFIPYRSFATGPVGGVIRPLFLHVIHITKADRAKKKKETPPEGSASVMRVLMKIPVRGSHFTIHSNTPAERRWFIVTSSLSAVVFTGLKLTVQGSPLPTG